MLGIDLGILSSKIGFEGGNFFSICTVNLVCTRNHQVVWTKRKEKEREVEDNQTFCG